MMNVEIIQAAWTRRVMGVAGVGAGIGERQGKLGGYEKT